MILNLTLNDDDFIAFNIYHIFHSKQHMRAIRFGRFSILVIAILAIAVCAAARLNVKVLIPEAVILLAVAIIWVAFYPVRLKKSIAKRIRKMRRDGQMPEEAEVKLELAEEAVIESTAASVRETPYSDFRELVDTGEYFYLPKVSVNETLIIPLRCLEDKDAVRKFFVSKWES